jgi:hypothetical protein
MEKVRTVQGLFLSSELHYVSGSKQIWLDANRIELECLFILACACITWIQVKKNVDCIVHKLLKPITLTPIQPLSLSATHNRSGWKAGSGEE